MAIPNITRNNTVDEWRIQTNQSANTLNTLETGTYTKTTGTLAIGANASLQVSNTALFSTDITVGRDITLGVQGTATGNLGVGGVVSIYGPGTALFIANNVVSNGTVVVRNTIIANNITANSNVVVVGTANVGFLGVANTGVFGQSVSVGNNLAVTGNAAIGGDATVTEDLDVGGDFSVTGSADVVGDLDIIGSLSTATSLNVGTNSIVTGNGYFGGTLQAVGNVAVGGTLQATGNVLFSGPGTALFVANNVVSNGTIVARNTIIANNITANSNVVVVGTANVGILQVSNTGIFNQSISVGNNVSVGNNLTVTGNTTLGGVLSLGGTLQANGAVSVGTSLLVGGDTTILGNLGVTGDFTLTGQTIIDTDTFIVGATTPITTGNAYFGVYRGNTQSTLGTVNANAYIRWAGTAKEWQLRDVDNSDLVTSFSKVLTANLITTSTATVSNSTFTSSWLTKNYVDTANTNLKSYVDTANTNLKSYTDNLVTTANTNLKNYSDSTFVKLNPASAQTIAQNLTLSGDVIISKNLTINGTVTTVNTQELNIADNQIVLNSDVSNNIAPSQDAGFIVNRGSSTNTYIQWNETIDSWVANNGITAGEFRLANTTTYLTEGTNLYLTAARVRANVSNTAPILYDSSTGVFSHATSGVTVATHGSNINVPVFVVNAQGHVTSVTNTAIRTTSTTQTGIVQLTDSTSSTSTTTAAVPNSVRTTYNHAQAAFGVANSATTTAQAAFNKANTAASTTQTGIVQLTDSTSSTSTTTAAVPNSVRTTFNHAQSAFNKANTAASTSVAGIVQLTDSTSSTSTTTAATPNALNTLRTTLATASQNGLMTSTFAAKLDGIAAGATNVTNTNQLTNGAGYIIASSTTTGLHTGAVRRPTSVISSNTSAVAGTIYIFTASLTLTLPSSPTAGDTIGVVNSSGTTTPVVARNGQNIMSLAEDLTINSINISFTLTYADATRGWVISL
jgi:UDP-3-O-[3-hydroxymyristoyl] glucosamine N-acyltransferase